MASSVTHPLGAWDQPAPPALVSSSLSRETPASRGCVPHPGRHTVLWSDVLGTQPTGQGQWYYLLREKPWDPPLMGLCWLGENVGHLAQYANPPMPRDVPQHIWSWATLQVTGGSKSGEAHPTGGHRPPGQPTRVQPRGQQAAGCLPRAGKPEAPPAPTSAKPVRAVVPGGPCG